MTYTAEERLYVNADRTRVVPEDSPEAHFLLVAEGGELPDDEAERLGLTVTKAEREAMLATTAEGVPVPSTAADPEPADDETEDEKAEQAAPNKARKPSEDK